MLHQTRLSLSASGATRRLPSPQGWARRVLNDGMVHIPVVSTRGKLAPPPCSGVEGVGWLCSPHTRQALSGMRCVLIKSLLSLRSRFEICVHDADHLLDQILVRVMRIFHSLDHLTPVRNQWCTRGSELG
jgi:hypothetical protein